MLRGEARKKKKLEGISSSIDNTEERIGELEDRVVEIIEAEPKKKRIKINEDSSRDFWDNIKYANTLIIGVPEGGERKRKGREHI